MNQNQKTKGSPEQELAPLAAAPLAADPVPRRVRIVPWGEVSSTNGRFTVDDESARLVADSFAEHGCDLPVDYEHQTLGGAYTSPTGQAPAAGWIKRLVPESGQGIWAEVEWTGPAQAQLAARQYRYLSPVAILRRSDRKLIALHSVALTNKPAIAGMPAIVNRDGGPCRVERARERLCRSLALDTAASDEELLVAAGHRLALMEEESRLRRANDRVAIALREGKLTPNQHDWAVRLFLRDESLFDEWADTAPVVVQPGRLEPPGPEAGPPDERAVTARARAEYRAHPELAGLTSEEAYVAHALRQEQVAADVA